MYVILSVIIVVASETTVRQQTPNPEAQFPEAEPPFLWSHSSAVTHSPFISLICVLHSEFGNETTEKRLKALPDFSPEGAAKLVAIEAQTKMTPAHFILTPIVD